jgi:large repetitive protein
MRRRGVAGVRAVPRWLLRGMLLTTGGAAAVVLGASASFAATLTVTYTGAPAPTTNTPLTWNVSQNPAGQMSCELDFGATVVSALADCGPSVTYSVAGRPAGTYTLVAYGDAAANVTGASKTLSSSIAVAPIAPTPSGPTGPSNNRAPQWALGLPSGATGACTLTTSGGAIVGSADPCPDPWTGPLGAAADGAYKLSVIARQGGLTSAPGTLTYTLDTTAPAAVTLTAPASPGNDRTPTFTVAGVEAGATVSCTATGPNGAVPVTSCTAASARLGLTGQPEGSYQLTVAQTDAAGNAGPAASKSYLLDVTPPPVPTVSAPPALTRQKTMTFTIGDAEAGATLTCVLTSPGASTVFSGVCPANGTFDTTGFADGVYTLVVTATDAAGNTSSTSVSWQRDSTPPPAPVITGPTAPVKDRTPTLQVTDAEPGVTLDCAVAGPSPATVTSCGTTTTLDLTGAADGDYLVLVTATDAAGNTRSSTFTVTLDTLAPPAPVITGPAAPINDRTPTLSVRDSEAGVTYSCSVSGPDAGAAVSACGSATTLDLTASADGDYLVTVTAADPAGNTSSSSFTVTLDTVAPPAPTVTSPASLTRATSVTVAISDTESGVNLSCLLTAPNGATVFTGGCPGTGTFDTTGFGDGLYTLLVTASDAAGNGSSTTVSWTRDTIAPPAPLATTASPTRSTSPTVTINEAEGTAVLTCVLTAPDAATVSSGGCPSGGGFDTTGFGDGVYTLVVTATDAAGNSSSTTVTWTRDTVAPPAPSVTGLAALTRSRSVTAGISDTESGVSFSCVLTAPGGATVFSGRCPVGGGFDTTGFGDGLYTLVVTATDAAGNSSSTTVSWTRDTVAPPVPSVSAPSSPAQGRSPSFPVTDAEAGVTFTCTVTGPSTVVVTSCGPTTTIDLSGAADGTYVVRVTATDAAGNTSAAGSASYVLDTTAPPAPDVSAPPALTTSSTVTLTISDSEGGVALTCRLIAPDGTVVRSGSCPAGGAFDTTGFGDGVYTLRVTATDAAGNATSTTVSWTRDTTAPPVPVVRPPASPAQGRTPSFSVSDAEPGVVYTCTVVGPSVVGVQACGPTTVVDLSGAADGTYTLRITATDAAGNTSAAGSAAYVLDTAAPPAPTVAAPVSPAQGRSPSFAVSDTEPGVTYSCTASGPAAVTFTTCGATTTLDLRGAPDGTYTVTVSAVDAAGNVSATRSASYVLDTTAPPAPAVSGLAVLTSSRSVTAAISDTEAGLRFSCLLTAPGGAVVRSGLCPADGGFDTTGFGDGVYTLRVTVTDAAGNSSSTTESWTRDTVAPPAPVVAAPRSPAQSRTPTFAVIDAEAGVTWVCSVTGPAAATVTACGPTTRLDLPGADGTYTVTISAVDAAGNVSSSTSVAYLLDATAPAAPAVGVTPSPAQGRHPSFTVSGVEAGGVVTCSLSAPAGAGVSLPVSCAPGVGLDLTGQPDGRYVLTVTVTDAAGNVSVAAVATYVLDTTAPAAPTVTSPANPSNDATPTFAIGAEPGASLTCSIARFFQTVWTGPCPADGTLDLVGYADGEFEVTVFATDAAGNVGPSTTAVYLLDTTAPERPLLTAPASPSPVTHPAWLWTAEDGTTSTCTVTNAGGVAVIGPVACTSPWTGDLSSLPDGAYTFSVVVTDPAGNISAAATSVFVLDRQAPIPPSVVPPASPDNDMTPTWQIGGPRNAVLTCTLLSGRKVIWGPAICPAGGTFSLAGLPDGTYTLRVTATDHAGNVSAAAVTTYVLDTAAPPSPTLDYGTSSPSTDTTPFWGFSLPPGSTGRCELVRGGTVIVSRNNCAGAVRFDLAGRPQGTYVVRIYAVDAAGNASDPLVITYVLGQASPVPTGSGTGTGTTNGTTGGPPSSGGGQHGGSHQLPALPTAPGAARQPLDELNRLSSLIKSDAKHGVQKAADTLSAVIPVIHDKITENVSHAVQGVVNAVSAAGGGTGFPLILLLVVLAFLVVQNRIDSRDPKLALASVAADDTVEFLPPPSRGGDR